MGKVIGGMTLSLDGFASDPNGDLVSSAEISSPLAFAHRSEFAT